VDGDMLAKWQQGTLVGEVERHRKPVAEETAEPTMFASGKPIAGSEPAHPTTPRPIWRMGFEWLPEGREPKDEGAKRIGAPVDPPAKGYEGQRDFGRM
jgi:hypothetical protein